MKEDISQFDIVMETFMQYWHAKTRHDLFYSNPPTYVLPLSWRPDFLFKKRGNGAPLMEVAWSVWIPGKHDTLYRPLVKPIIE